MVPWACRACSPRTQYQCLQDKDASLGSFVFPYISSRAGTADQQDLALSISQSDILQEYAADLNQYV